MRIRQRSAALILLAGLTASCSLPGESRFAARIPVPTVASAPIVTPPPADCAPKPVGIRFKFAPETTAHDRALIRDALIKAREYYPLRFPRASRFSLLTDTNVCYPAAYYEPVVSTLTEPEGRYIAWYRWGRGMRFYIGIPEWRAAPDRYKYLVAFHEAYHWYQHLAPKTYGAGNLRHPEPVWLVEGAAEWHASEAAVHFGLADSLEDAQLHPPLRLSRSQLPDFEKSREEISEYDYRLFFEASDLLIRKHGGRRAMRVFWNYENAYEDWRVYFQRAFGISVKKFYKEFAAL